MDIIGDILKICKDDLHHDIKITIDGGGLTVYLEDMDSNGECVIPIEYDCLSGGCCIPHDELLDIFHPNEYGIDRGEIKLISRIMDYLYDNSSEINSLCDDLI